MNTSFRYEAQVFRYQAYEKRITNPIFVPFVNLLSEPNEASVTACNGEVVGSSPTGYLVSLSSVGRAPKPDLRPYVWIVYTI